MIHKLEEGTPDIFVANVIPGVLVALAIPPYVFVADVGDEILNIVRCDDDTNPHTHYETLSVVEVLPAGTAHADYPAYLCGFVGDSIAYNN